MILEIDNSINPYYFIFAGFCSWLLLAGFLVSPSTYASVQHTNALDKSGEVGKSIINAVRNVPLIYIASFACLGATVGLIWLWHRWRLNHIWISRYLIVPTLMHSAVGLGTAILNIYSIQGGQWSITAIVTVSIVGAWLVISVGLYILYNFFLLPRLKELPGTRMI
ncbi:hypothetical protein M441DRAFT_70211 [Trichoderma asperellum CBS 433.97]|uniref:Uncharacterized protein n=1 Tax=Trichoderma asperellum (strain ATCC 204424 / CBS 433.97 / NBRC 101777) TaxID=1042311 RepID=A0A2T3Z6I0_TRIA4|nr:hypothetical protein M441DRAFT_70211 [Trichoderma asperellum CBS 433.97]PTB40413.1 hypothetical protein M441DRAFT_70211 [Trichoderma asperellum CBS 433.97]